MGRACQWIVDKVEFKEADEIIVANGNNLQVSWGPWATRTYVRLWVHSVLCCCSAGAQKASLGNLRLHHCPPRRHRWCFVCNLVVAPWLGAQTCVPSFWCAGTFDEMWEVACHNAVGFGKIPMVVLSIDGYYDGACLFRSMSLFSFSVSWQCFNFRLCTGMLGSS